MSIAAARGHAHMGLRKDAGEPMDERSTPERPRSEPEILPPERSDGPMRDARWERAGAEGVYRVRVVKLGPVGATLLAIGIGVASAVLLVLMLSTVLILIPVVGLLIAVAIIAGLLRGYFPRT
jgi:hypothetical protein